MFICLQFLKEFTKTVIRHKTSENYNIFDLAIKQQPVFIKAAVWLLNALQESKTLVELKVS